MASLARGEDGGGGGGETNLLSPDDAAGKRNSGKVSPRGPPPDRPLPTPAGGPPTPNFRRPNEHQVAEVSPSPAGPPATTPVPEDKEEGQSFQPSTSPVREKKKKFSLFQKPQRAGRAATAHPTIIAQQIGQTPKDGTSGGNKSPGILKSGSSCSNLNDKKKLGLTWDNLNADGGGEDTGGKEEDPSTSAKRKSKARDGRKGSWFSRGLSKLLNKENLKSLRSSAISSSTAGEVEIRLTFEDYQPLLELIRQPRLHLAQSLIRTVPLNEAESLSCCLYNCFFFNYDLLVRLILLSVEEEINHEGVDSSTLFRSSSVASKLVSSFFRSFGTGYISVALSDAITHIAESDLSHEVDPSKLPDTAPSSTATDNLHNLRNSCELVLECLTQSEPYFPSELRSMCHSIRRIISSKFPDKEFIGLGGFVFLRFIGPAVVTPTQFGTVEELEVSATARRSLVLITKVLQNMSNGVDFGTKEPFMEPMNEFMHSNAHRLRSLLENMSDINRCAKDIKPNPGHAHINKDNPDEFVGGSAEDPLVVTLTAQSPETRAMGAPQLGDDFEMINQTDAEEAENAEGEQEQLDVMDVVKIHQILQAQEGAIQACVAKMDLEECQALEVIMAALGPAPKTKTTKRSTIYSSRHSRGSILSDRSSVRVSIDGFSTSSLRPKSTDPRPKSERKYDPEALGGATIREKDRANTDILEEDVSPVAGSTLEQVAENIQNARKQARGSSELKEGEEGVGGGGDGDGVDSSEDVMQRDRMTTIAAEEHGRERSGAFEKDTSKSLPYIAYHKQEEKDGGGGEGEGEGDGNDRTEGGDGGPTRRSRSLAFSEDISKEL